MKSVSSFLLKVFADGMVVVVYNISYAAQSRFDTNLNLPLAAAPHLKWSKHIGKGSLDTIRIMFIYYFVSSDCCRYINFNATYKYMKREYK